MEWSQWLAAIKQYGPVAGVLAAYVFWQARWIDRLLDRHEKAYTGEIDRMHQQMNKLLAHVLGPQPSSASTPTMEEIMKAVESITRQSLEPGAPARSGGEAP